MVGLNIIPQVSKARNGVGAFVLPVSILIKKEIINKSFKIYCLINTNIIFFFKIELFEIKYSVRELLYNIVIGVAHLKV